MKVIPVCILVFCIKAALSQPVINEVLSSNISGIEDEYDHNEQNCPVPDCEWWFARMGRSTHDGEYPDWIEIYNPGTEAMDLRGYGLSDDPANPHKWIFPHVLLAPEEFLLVFASGKDRREPPDVKNILHTNFKIDRTGETILLTDDSGELCDRVDTGPIPVDFSLGRYPDGGAQWVIFSQPTPSNPNTTSPFPGFTDSVQVSHPGGFYPGEISLSLSAYSPAAQIRFTLNGDTPSPRSTLYSQPIPIDQTVVVKARVFEDGSFSSKILTQTYFIDEKFTFPVISLSTPPDNLWDDEIGIYVPGDNADEGNRVANYWQDWERPVHVEFFEPEGINKFNIDAGIKIFGWGSRSNALKSVSIMIRDRYGCDVLDYPLFPDLQITKFNAFVLRAAGNDWQGTFFRDPLATGLIKEKNVEIQAFRPAIVFVNGEYWGIHNIREKLNEDYLAQHYGVDRDNLDIISRYWRRTYPVIIEGDDQAYLAMEHYLENNDINQPEHYEMIKSIVDIDNYIEYCVSQIYFANYDWPGNNNKCWRTRTPFAKWRWLMYDLDYSFNSNGNNNASHNTLEHATVAENPDWPNPPHTTFLLRSLFKSDRFKIDFINRFADFMNTVFVTDNLFDNIDKMSDLFAPEIERHIERWRRYTPNLRSVNDWERNIDVLREFSSRRRQYVRGHICDKFDLEGWENLRLDVAGDNGGKVKINSIIIENFPWNGDYFIGIPIRLSALPHSGYRFTHWKGLSFADSLSTPITVTLSADLALTACFEKNGHTASVPLFNEINYNSSVDFNPEDWVELYNPSGSSIDLSDWIFRDENDNHGFRVPGERFIPADGYIVLCRDKAAFRKLFPGVDNCIGDFEFGLDSDRDMLRLFDDQGLIVDSLTYINKAPWPAAPDGRGPTLSLRSPHLDNSKPENWGVSSGCGTPGSPNELTVAAVTGSSETPSSFSLMQNYPNPFNAFTKISYSIPQKNVVELAVFDIRGREISILVNSIKSAGRYTLVFDASDLASGLYFYRLSIGSSVLTRKMISLK